MIKIEIYASGSCTSNPGPSGWAVIFKDNEQERSFSGFISQSTNNRILLIAVINAFERLVQPCAVTLYCNATYITDFFKRGWYDKWVQHGGNIEFDKSIKNRDLWEQLMSLMETHEVNYVHINDGGNEVYLRECKRLAKEACRQAG
jgi:ribonuclease HI